MFIEIKGDEEFKGILKGIKEGLNELAAGFGKMSGASCVAGSVEKTEREAGDKGSARTTHEAVERCTVKTNDEVEVRNSARTTHAESTGSRTGTAYTAGGSRIGIKDAKQGERMSTSSGIEVEDAPKAKIEQQPLRTKLALEEVRAALALMKPQEAKKLIQAYGVSRLTELPESCYENLMKKAGEILC